jgi:hypothetical protein
MLAREVRSVIMFGRSRTVVITEKAEAAPQRYSFQTEETLPSPVGAAVVTKSGVVEVTRQCYSEEKLSRFLERFGRAVDGLRELMPPEEFVDSWVMWFADVFPSQITKYLRKIRDGGNGSPKYRLLWSLLCGERDPETPKRVVELAGEIGGRIREAVRLCSKFRGTEDDVELLDFFRNMEKSSM